MGRVLCPPRPVQHRRVDLGPGDVPRPLVRPGVACSAVVVSLAIPPAPGGPAQVGLFSSGDRLKSRRAQLGTLRRDALTLAATIREIFVNSQRPNKSTGSWV
jgi:hypothetical protein